MFSMLIISYKNITKIFCEGKSLLDYWNFLVLERPIIIFFLFVEYLERISYFSFRIMISTISILREWWRELWWTKKGEEGGEKKLGFIDWAGGILKSPERRRDHTPLLDRGCLCFAILAVRQPAPEWRAEEGEGEEEIMKVSHENRSRIRKLKVVLDRGNVAKFDEDRKNGGGFFFFFFLLSSRFDYSYGDERRNNRGIGFAGYHRWNIAKLFPVYFYMFVWIWKLIHCSFIWNLRESVMMRNVSYKYWIILEFWNYEIVERISVYLTR